MRPNILCLALLGKTFTLLLDLLAIYARVAGFRTFTKRNQPLLYKAAHEQVAVTIPPYAIPPVRDLRGHSPRNYVNIGAKKEIYKYSFMPRTIRVWNLIQHITTQQSSASFQNSLWGALSNGSLVLFHPRARDRPQVGGYTRDLIYAY